MEDKLKKFMQDNREGFDDLEPSEGLWQKIIPDHEIKEVKRKPGLQAWALRVAAVLLIGLVSVFAYDRLFVQKNTAPIVEAAEEKVMEVDPELKELIEAESYYTREVNAKLAQLDQYEEEFGNVKQEVLYDFAELDTAYMELKAELGGDVYNHEVVESMIQNYRIKLEILEEVLSQLEEDSSAEGEEQEKEKNYEA